jgi:ABC-type molybdate transport system ATPase subunit
MPADPCFVGHLTGRQNLELLADLRGGGSPDRERIASLLSLPEHDLDRPVRAFSSGMRQKLAVVAALQHRPDLVVLDEPANRWTRSRTMPSVPWCATSRAPGGPCCCPRMCSPRSRTSATPSS